MPTRSGLEYKEINSAYVVCAYCYEAVRCELAFAGMVRKRMEIRVDDEFVTVPGEYNEIWTEPHCYQCHRRVLGYPVWAHYPRKHKY